MDVCTRVHVKTEPFTATNMGCFSRVRTQAGEHGQVNRNSSCTKACPFLKDPQATRWALGHLWNGNVLPGWGSTDTWNPALFLLALLLTLRDWKRGNFLAMKLESIFIGTTPNQHFCSQTWPSEETSRCSCGSLPLSEDSFPTDCPSARKVTELSWMGYTFRGRVSVACLSGGIGAGAAPVAAAAGGAGSPTDGGPAPWGA